MFQIGKPGTRWLKWGNNWPNGGGKTMTGLLSPDEGGWCNNRGEKVVLGPNKSENTNGGNLRGGTPRREPEMGLEFVKVNPTGERT